MRKKIVEDKFLYADAQYSDNGQILYMEYYYDSEIFGALNHKEDGPAIEHWYSNGQKKSESYYINGKMHNENGPAHKEWFSNGKLKYKEYWLNDVEYTKFEWLIKVRKLKLEKLNGSNL